MGFGNINWHDVFVPDTPLVEIFVRGTIVYLAIFALLRFVLTRQSGNLGVTDWLAYHFPTFRRLIHPPPLELIRDGKVNRRNMRSELITMEELKAQLREQGIEDLTRVRKACMEGDGRISVVSDDEEQHQKPSSPNT